MTKPVLPETVYEELAEAQDVGIYIHPYGKLTNADEIRAVFGLSDVELPTEMLQQNVYVQEVQSALRGLNPQAATLYGQRSEDEALVTSFETFATYCIANKICDVLPLIAARTLTDSKSTFQRFDIDLQKVVDSIRSRYANAAKALQDALAEAATEPVGFFMLGSGSPTYDPVTGQ